MLISPLLLTALVVPDVLRVPEDFSTVQAAVDAAAPGDVVQVGAGKWSGHVVVATPALTLRGAGAGATTLDGGASGRVLDVAAAGVSVEDLELAHGTADVGGALRVVGDDVSLLRVHVHDSTCTRPFELGGGAGAYVQGDRFLAEACEFAGNDAEFLNVGAGLWVAGDDAVVRDCGFVDNGGEFVLGCAAALFGDGHRIEGCLALANGGDFAECLGFYVAGVGATILRNSFVLNAGVESRACVRLDGSDHLVRDATFLDTWSEFTGAVLCDAADSRVSLAIVDGISESAIRVTGSCELRDVQVRDFASNYGDAAIAVVGSGGGSMERVLVEGGGFGFQDGLSFVDTNFAAYDVLVANCQVSAGVNALDSTLLLEGCAIVDCDDPFGRQGGCALRVTGRSDVLVSNSILFNPDLDEELGETSLLPTFDHCLVRGGAPGRAVLDATPQYAGGSSDPLEYYRPAVGSPTVDAGDPERFGLRLDLARGARRIDGDLNGTAVVDLGPLERTDTTLRIVATTREVQRLRVDGPPTTLGILVSGMPAAALPLEQWGSLYFELNAETQLHVGIRPLPFEVDVPLGVEPGRVAQGFAVYPFGQTVVQVTNPVLLGATSF